MGRIALFLCLFLCGCTVSLNTEEGALLPKESEEESIPFISEVYFPVETTENMGQYFYWEVDARFFDVHHSEYLEMMSRSLELSQSQYKSNMWAEAQNLLDRLWAEYPDPDSKVMAMETVSALYPKMMIQVKSGEEDPETGDYFLRVGVSPLLDLSFITEDYLIAQFNGLTAEVDILGLSQEDYASYDNMATQLLLEEIAQSKTNYGEEREIVLQFRPDDRGYLLEEHDWYQFCAMLVA